MDYKVYPLEDSQIICIEIKGKQYFKPTKVAIQEAVAKARERNWNRVLMDMTQSSLQYDIIYSLDIIKNVDKLGYEHTDCFAGVYNPNHIDKNHHLFAETAALNRLYIVKYFTKRELATTWLQKQSSKITIR